MLREDDEIVNTFRVSAKCCSVRCPQRTIRVRGHFIRPCAEDSAHYSNAIDAI